ncbi:hypothetical protein E3N88_36037 [Mikania micrantha]|uniref:Uncharacterized protein n=1 Tax=Mikania micrantha TaxID=192012 RepID=A0A5N6M2R7_9ASTR|nr:hypothetical protein E3N88_36037 [Mikania micrantha]
MSEVVRISMTDPDATDSSSDEEDELFVRRRVKKYVNEVKLQTSGKPTVAAVSCRRKFGKPVKVEWVIYTKTESLPYMAPAYGGRRFFALTTVNR